MIRDAIEDDAAAICEIYEPIVRRTAISFETEPPSIETIRKRISSSHAWLVYESDDRVQGYAYGAPFHPRSAYQWSAEVTIYVSESARGTGVGRALLSSLLETLTQKGIVNAFAGIALPNRVSVRLFESFGFDQIALQRKVGFKLNAWRDVGWWQRQLREPSVPPPNIS